MKATWVLLQKMARILMKNIYKNNKKYYSFIKTKIRKLKIMIRKI
jgi:hypothetical protein